jgi:hypothetical protein
VKWIAAVVTALAVANAGQAQNAVGAPPLPAASRGSQRA